MIIVLCKLTVKPGKKAELLQLAKGVMAATQKEEGCISYVLYDHPHDPTGCMFVEEWADKDALRKHSASTHIAEWRQQSAPFITGRDLKFFEAAPTTL